MTDPKVPTRIVHSNVTRTFWETPADPHSDRVEFAESVSAAEFDELFHPQVTDDEGNDFVDRAAFDRIRWDT